VEHTADVELFPGSSSFKLVGGGAMKTVFLLTLLFSLLIPFQRPTSTSESSPLDVTSFKWSRARRTVENPDIQGIPPARAMIPQNRNFARNARINDPQGVRDPNQDTLDGRSAAMEKNVAESRVTKAKDMDGYAYRIKVRNDDKRVIDVVSWEYQFQDPANPQFIARRQFLCGVSIPGGKNRELEGFSLSGPSDVVNVKTLGDNAKNPFKETVAINRIEYSDGSIWQRENWSLAEVKASYERVLREQWSPGMCKGLSN
jgi:hypothetical protein